MDYLTVIGVRPYDGRYEFDLSGAPLTTREWGWIKRHSGYLPLTIEDGVDGSDPELFAAFAVIALRRAGRISNREVAETFDRIADSPFDRTIRFESDGEGEGEEEDANPPPPSSDESESISGTSLKAPSDPSERNPNPIGTPASDISGSRSARLAS